MTFNFLHFTDLHLGMHNIEQWWPNVESQLFRDISYLTKKSGQIDGVFFSGDLVQSGKKAEFESLEILLGKIWKKFSEMGSNPVFLAVPGNHDLTRPADLYDPSVQVLLKLWSSEENQIPFWSKPLSQQRTLINNVFSNYSHWWAHTAHKPLDLKEGLLPGDFSATIVKDGFRLGIMGLNTTFLQLTGEDFKGKLALGIQQFNYAGNGNGPEWAGSHDACILMTHQGPEWLDEASRKILLGEIYTPERFVLQLHGHMHEPSSRGISEGYSPSRYWLQGPSLFGLETWNDGRSSRIHGYQLVQLQMDDLGVRYKTWPRIAVERQDGSRTMQADQSNDLDRDDKESTALIWVKKTGLTSPEQSVSKPVDHTSYSRWLMKKTEKIDIRGIGNAGGKYSFPILELYIKLYINPEGLTDQFWKSLGISKQLAKSTGKRILLTDVAQKIPYLLIEGEAGSGKTTFLRYLAHLYGEDLSKPLPLLMDTSELLEFRSGLPLANGKWLSRVVLLYWLNQSEKYDWGFTEVWLTTMFKKGGVIMLLDGIDQLQNREDQIETRYIIDDFNDVWPETPWVITSRPKVVEGEGRPLEFQAVKIARLGSLERNEFIKTWAKHVLWRSAPDFKHNLETEDYTASLIHAIEEREDLQDLANNPVMLTAMAIVHWNYNTIPEGRTQIYEAIIDWLLKSRRGQKKEYYHNKKRECYEVLALEMFRDPEGRKSDATEKWAAHQIAPILAKAKGEEYEESEEQIDAAYKFFETEKLETGLIVSKEFNTIAFMHLTFQEYLAACRIASKADVNDWWPLIEEHIAAIDWHNLLQFTAVKFLPRGGTKQLLVKILETRKDDSLAETARIVGLVADIFHDSTKQGFDFKEVKEYVDARNKVMEIFKAEGDHLDIQAKYEAAVGLGKGGDPRLQKLNENWASIPPGRCWIGAQNNDTGKQHYDEHASTGQYPVHQVFTKSFEIGKFPVTVKEYAVFIAENGYKNRAFWDERGWAWITQKAVSQPEFWEDQSEIPNQPVVNVSWYEADAYCNWLSFKHKSYIHQLPTEAEWEYVARLGNREYQRFVFGNKEPKDVSRESNMEPAGLPYQSPVGLFPDDRVLANAPQGTKTSEIFDMNGNVMQWVLDADPSEYSEEIKPASLAYNNLNAIYYAVRGGSWHESPYITAHRTSRIPTTRTRYIGFRIIRRKKADSLKGRLPALYYSVSLADYYAKHNTFQYEREEAQRLLDQICEDVIKIDTELIDRLFPNDIEIGKAKRLPLMMKDATFEKVDYNLRYQDTRVKIIVEEKTNAAIEASRLHVPVLLEIVAIFLRIRTKDNLLWEIMTDNDLNALTALIADKYDANRIPNLIELGHKSNREAVNGLQSVDNLAYLSTEELIPFIVFAGGVWWTDPTTRVDNQFAKMRKLQVDASAHFIKKISSGPCKMLYFLSDNGELVWDLFFIMHLFKKHLQLFVEVVINTEVVENDAHYKTLSRCLEYADFQAFKTSDRFAVFKEPVPRSSLDLSTCSKDLENKMEAADLVFIKGTSNFETIQALSVDMCYAFVVGNDDSSDLTGYKKQSGIFAMIPPKVEAYNKMNNLKLVDVIDNLEKNNW